ncbi:MAG: hypothetical protein U0P45_15560 [Acidimicrobiales bacterium]
MGTRSTVRIAALALAGALALAACGGGSDKASDTTTTKASSGSGSSSSGSDSGGTPTTAAGGVTAGSTGGPTCKEFQAAVDKVVGTPSAKVEDMGGNCTVSLNDTTDTPRVSMLWNYGAASKDSWEGLINMMGDGMKAVDGHGDAAVTGIDTTVNQADAWIWIDGKGAYQLAYIPPFVSDTKPTQDNIDTLLAIGDELQSQS